MRKTNREMDYVCMHVRTSVSPHAICAARARAESHKLKASRGKEMKGHTRANFSKRLCAMRTTHVSKSVRT